MSKEYGNEDNEYVAKLVESEVRKEWGVES